MALADRAERVGIVVGSAFLGALAVTPLVSAFAAPDYPSSRLLLAVAFAPGVAVGVLVALDRAPVTYAQLWVFSLVAGLAPALLWSVAGVPVPPSPGFAVATWLAAAAAGAVLARRR